MIRKNSLSLVQALLYYVKTGQYNTDINVAGTEDDSLRRQQLTVNLDRNAITSPLIFFHSKLNHLMDHLLELKH